MSMLSISISYCSIWVIFNCKYRDGGVGTVVNHGWDVIPKLANIAVIENGYVDVGGVLIGSFGFAGLQHFHLYLDSAWLIRSNFIELITSSLLHLSSCLSK